MRTSVFALGAISLAASLAFATPASATSTVAVNGACSNMTDGVASSCHFSGNITTGTNGAGDYRLTENAYNNVYAPAHNYPANLNLTPLAEFDAGNEIGHRNGITFSRGSLSGTFTLAPGVDLGYYAVKAGNQFILYEFTGTGDWSHTTGALLISRLATASSRAFRTSSSSVPSATRFPSRRPGR